MIAECIPTAAALVVDVNEQFREFSKALIVAGNRPATLFVEYFIESNE